MAMNMSIGAATEEATVALLVIYAILTYWSLGDLNEILDMQFSNRF